MKSVLKASLSGSDPRGGQAPYGRVLFLAAILLLAAVLSVRLAFEVHRLLLAPDVPIDVANLRRMIREWFGGIPFYEDRGGIHPPAVFVLLWPLYGWGPPAVTRWLFALTAAIVGAAFGRFLLRESRPASARDCVLLSVLLLGGYPTAITIGNGQLTIFILGAAVAAVFVCLRRNAGAGRDALLTGLFLVALIKPTLTVPFFWVIAFSRGWLRPAILALTAYVAVTWISIVLHGMPLGGVLEMLRSWYARAEFGMAQTGYGNIHDWLGDRDLDVWVLPASGLVFALHGLWASRHREADLWVLLGVAAIVARVWAYHRVYDDLLLIVPLVALYRLGRGASDDRAAWALFLVAAASLAAPVTPILAHASWALVTVWLLQLTFLMHRARRAPRAAGGRATGPRSIAA